MQYKLIIFDWDGTLMDSFNKIVSTFNCVALETNMPLRSATQIRHTVGMGLQDAFSQLYPDVNFPQNNHAVELYRKYWLADNQTQSPFYPGVISGLECLVEEGYVLAVATGKSRSGLNKMLDKHNLHRLFSYSRCSDETQPKPHPQMLLDILSFSGYSAKQCVMIGDTTFDMEMANRANINTIGVSYGSHTADMLNRYAPKQVVGDFEQLISLICSARST